LKDRPRVCLAMWAVLQRYEACSPALTSASTFRILLFLWTGLLRWNEGTVQFKEMRVIENESLNGRYWIFQLRWGDQRMEPLKTFNLWIMRSLWMWNSILRWL
jgi:hypothetical protein